MANRKVVSTVDCLVDQKAVQKADEMAARMDVLTAVWKVATKDVMKAVLMAYN